MNQLLYHSWTRNTYIHIQHESQWFSYDCHVPGAFHELQLGQAWPECRLWWILWVTNKRLNDRREVLSFPTRTWFLSPYSCHSIYVLLHPRPTIYRPFHHILVNHDRLGRLFKVTFMWFINCMFQLTFIIARFNSNVSSSKWSSLSSRVFISHSSPSRS